MAFASINTTNPRTNLWNFREKNSRIGGFENLSFFESAILFFFCFIPMKISQSLLVSKDGSNMAKHDDTFWPVPDILSAPTLFFTQLYITFLFYVGNRWDIVTNMGRAAGFWGSPSLRQTWRYKSQPTNCHNRNLRPRQGNFKAQNVTIYFSLFNIKGSNFSHLERHSR